MDALSQVLKSLRLDGAIFLDAEFTAPWCVNSEFGLSNALSQLGRDQHIVFFHWLTEGQCKVELSGRRTSVDAKAGDLIMFPHDKGHLLGSDPRLPASDWPIDRMDVAAGMPQLRLGGGGAATKLVCGYVACNPKTLQPLLAGLPEMLIVPLEASPIASLLRQVLRSAVEESSTSRVGSGSALAKLAEFLFVEAIRCFAENQELGAKSWLAGLRDGQVGRALALLHSEPARNWTVDDLAHEVALSRSALAKRFVSLIGISPIQYLARLRLNKAADELLSSATSISRISQRSGYESEAAFSRAFKREFGLSPVTWRRSHMQAQG